MSEVPIHRLASQFCDSLRQAPRQSPNMLLHLCQYSRWMGFLSGIFAYNPGKALAEAGARYCTKKEKPWCTDE
jgi:hypothetical protein